MPCQLPTCYQPEEKPFHACVELHGLTSTYPFYNTSTSISAWLTSCNWQPQYSSLFHLSSSSALAATSQSADHNTYIFLSAALWPVLTTAQATGRCSQKLQSEGQQVSFSHSLTDLFLYYGIFLLLSFFPLHIWFTSNTCEDYRHGFLSSLVI